MKFIPKMCKAFGFINVIASICASNQPSEVKNERTMREMCAWERRKTETAMTEIQQSASNLT